MCIVWRPSSVVDSQPAAVPPHTASSWQVCPQYAGVVCRRTPPPVCVVMRGYREVVAEVSPGRRACSWSMVKMADHGLAKWAGVLNWTASEAVAAEHTVAATCWRHARSHCVFVFVVDVGVCGGAGAPGVMFYDTVRVFEWARRGGGGPLDLACGRVCLGVALVCRRAKAPIIERCPPIMAQRQTCTAAHRRVPGRQDRSIRHPACSSSSLGTFMERSRAWRGDTCSQLVPGSAIGLSAGQAMFQDRFGRMAPGFYSFWHLLQYYFDVNNSYVSNKLKLILLPFRHKDWKRRGASDDGTPTGVCCLCVTLCGGAQAWLRRPSICHQCTTSMRRTCTFR